MTMTKYILCHVRNIFSLSTNISIAIKFFQSRYCKKDSWKNNSSPVVTWQNISFVMLHIFHVHTKIFRILLSLCNSAWQNIHSCIENVKIFSYVTKNMCNVTKDVFRTALLLSQKILTNNSPHNYNNLSIIYPQMFVPFFWSTAQKSALYRSGGVRLGGCRAWL